MKVQTTFKRYEIKYVITKEQKKTILEKMNEYMKLDQYGRTTIQNIYFDTNNYRLIRNSIEKPIYKEKLRIRNYGKEKEKTIFIELKKKYKSVVYKRRLAMDEKEVFYSFNNEKPLPIHSQIAEEIEYFRKYYCDLHPSIYLSYEREAYYAIDDSDFRITMDENILFREEDFNFKSNIYGKSLLEEGYTLLEVKTAFSLPLWFTHLLDELGIYKTSFSKYGRAYTMIQKEKKLYV